MANDYGMTSQGFIPKRLAQIQDDINNDLEEITHHETGEKPFQNASDDSLLQQIVGVFSEALAECWNAAYHGSVQFDPLKNSGAGQSGTVQLNAMLRKPGSSTIIEMELSGTPATAIPQGSQIATRDRNHTYSTTTAAVITSSGTVTVYAKDIEMSTYVPEIGDVIRILTLPAGGGWMSATNIALISEGTKEETDEELRIRQQRSTSLTSYRLIEAIYAAILNINGVQYCRAYQNPRTYPEDSRGIPFKEVAVVVEGGDNTEIAEALFLRLPTGQVGYGDVTETLYDMQGYPHPISFSRPENIEIYVVIVISITDRSQYPDDGADQIKANIIEFAKYGGEGSENGFPPGADIIRSRIYTPVNQVGGHSVHTLLIGTSAAVADEDIAMAWNQVGRFDENRISVTIL